VGEPLDDFEGEGEGFDVEALADLFADEAEVVGRGEHVGVDDFAHDGGQALERFVEFVGAARAGFRLSRRSWVCGNGGVWLFCLVPEEFHEELVVIHLLAPGSVEAFEQSGDNAFLDGEFGFQRSDFGGEFLALLFGRPDVFPICRRHAMSWI
jgi:hypothetical protein